MHSVDERDQLFHPPLVRGIIGELRLQPTLLPPRLEVEEYEKNQRSHRGGEAAPDQSPAEKEHGEAAVDGVANDGEDAVLDQGGLRPRLGEWRQAAPAQGDR